RRRMRGRGRAPPLSANAFASRMPAKAVTIPEPLNRGHRSVHRRVLHEDLRGTAAGQVRPDMSNSTAPGFPGSPSSKTCFALLDDCTATAQRPRSRLYTGHEGTLVCERADQLAASFDAMDLATRAGLHAV